MNKSQSFSEMLSRLPHLAGKWRFWLLIISLIFAVWMIQPMPWHNGVAVVGVSKEGLAAQANLVASPEHTQPMKLEIITHVNDVPVSSVEEYVQEVEKSTRSVYLTSNKGSYLIQLDDNSNTSNQSIISQLGIRVRDAPKSNIRTGLDLQGGTRVLLEPSTNLSTEDFQILKQNVEQRLNLFGLSDIRVSVINDKPIGGQPRYLLVEMAGVGIDEVSSLISRQGKFEAKIVNQTVFTGSDVKAVSTSAQSGAGVDARTCGPTGDGAYACQYSFPITLSIEGASAQAKATQNLEIVGSGSQRYLSQNIDLYLDDALVDSLRIAAELRGSSQTQISISGSGVGATQQAAFDDAIKNMKEMQTVLKTGGLPAKLTIVRADTISASLGKTFINNVFFIALLAILGVALVTYARYRELAITIPMVLTSMCEIILLLGFAALIGWNIDLAAIAGIIITIGSGINHQIIIADELRSGERRSESWKMRLKNAFTVIMLAYFTTIVAMLPLMFAGAGLLKGFALTTIAGVTMGVFITRPAYGAVSQVLHE